MTRSYVRSPRASANDGVDPARSASATRQSCVRALPHRQRDQVVLPGGLEECAGPGVVSAHDERAVRLHRADEVGERRVVGLLGPPHVEMVGIDIGHHRGLRVVDEERAVALVGLRHEEVAGTRVGVAPGGGEDTADRVRRIRAGGSERHRQHRGGRRLAVGAGDGDHGVPGHRRLQPGRPGQDPQPPGPALDDLGVVVVGGRGHDEGVGVADVLGGVPQVDGYADLAHRREERGVLVVAAGDGHALLGHDPGDRRQPGAADADEVDAPEVDGRRDVVGHRDPHPGSPRSCSTEERSGGGEELRGVVLIPRLRRRGSSGPASRRRPTGSDGRRPHPSPRGGCGPAAGG